MNHQTRSNRSIAAFVAACSCALFLSGLVGCGTSKHYSAKTDLVTRMGVADAEEALREILENAPGPIMSEVQVGRDLLEFSCQQASVEQSVLSSRQTSIRYYGCTDTDMRIAFTDIARIDIVQPERYVILRNAAERSLLRVQPRSDDELTRMVDLLASLRAYSEQQTGKSAAPLIVEQKRATELDRRFNSEDL